MAFCVRKILFGHLRKLLSVVIFIVSVVFGHYNDSRSFVVADQIEL